ncbi:MAG TPA: ubiquinone-binding protein [Xanthomonadales bacterium]|nr:ubiquinone-binding protein [Xanthomonadales bacterium]
MAVIRRSALVRLSAAAMFDLVNDVRSYPRWFDWCRAGEVLSVSEAEMLARLTVRVAGVETAFTTRNTLARPAQIDLALEQGPFRHLRGVWTFSALAEDACKVGLAMDFEPAGRWLGSTLAMGFERVADRMVDDFCRVALRQP